MAYKPDCCCKWKSLHLDDMKITFFRLKRRGAYMWVLNCGLVACDALVPSTCHCPGAWADGHPHPWQWTQACIGPCSCPSTSDRLADCSTRGQGGSATGTPSLWAVAHHPGSTECQETHDIPRKRTKKTTQLQHSIMDEIANSCLSTISKHLEHALHIQWLKSRLKKKKAVSSGPFRVCHNSVKWNRPEHAEGACLFCSTWHTSACLSIVGRA